MWELPFVRASLKPNFGQHEGGTKTKGTVYPACDPGGKAQQEMGNRCLGTLVEGGSFIQEAFLGQFWMPEMQS